MFQEDCQNGLIEINGGTCHIADKHDWILPVKMVDLSSGLFLVSLEQRGLALVFTLEQESALLATMKTTVIKKS